MKFLNTSALAATGLTIGLLGAVPANATVYGGVDFPQGAISFADQVVEYDVANGGSFDTLYQVPGNAIGAPDDASATLGSGGTIILKFTDNFLTGNGTSSNDLWIFEIGPDVESTFVWLSKDGSTWLTVGEIQGSTRGIDIDSFGYGVDDQFAYVKLTDDPNQGDTGGQSPGADIDSVGAISTVRQTGTGVPEPATLALFGAGAAGLRFLRRKRKA
ncbi:MAG TPA: PEP-CTERM sorting domain-containing protein [Rhizomicrobium sp.]|jgi:hypothetical protein